MEVWDLNDNYSNQRLAILSTWAGDSQRVKSRIVMPTVLDRRNFLSSINKVEI